MLVVWFALAPRPVYGLHRRTGGIDILVVEEACIMESLCLKYWTVTKWIF